MNRLAAIAGSYVREAMMLLLVMAFSSASIVQAQESSPEVQEADTATEAPPAADSTVPPIEVQQEADAQPEPKPEEEPGPEPVAAEPRPRPVSAAPAPRPRQTTAQVQTAVPAPLQQPEPEGVERGTEGGEPTAYSPVEGYVATRSAPNPDQAQFQTGLYI